MAKNKTRSDFDFSAFTASAEGDDLSPNLLTFPEPAMPMAPPYSVPGDAEPISPDPQDDPFALPPGIEPVTHKRKKATGVLNSMFLTLAVLVLALSAIVLLLVALTQLPAIITRDSPTQAVERFVAAFNTGDEDKMRTTVDPELRSDISGIITNFTTDIAGAVGVKVYNLSCTEGPTQGNVTPVKMTGNLEYMLTSSLGDVVYRKGFTAEMATVKRENQWYVRGLSGFTFSDK
jgi:hypothetical protein